MKIGGRKLALRYGSASNPIQCYDVETSTCSSSKDCGLNMDCNSGTCVAKDNKILGHDNVNFIDNTFNEVLCCSYDLNEDTSHRYFQTSSIASVLDVKINNEIVEIETGFNIFKNPSPSFYEEYDNTLQLEEDKQYTYRYLTEAFLNVDKLHNSFNKNAELYESITETAEYSKILDHNILEAYQLYYTVKPNSNSWLNIFTGDKSYDDLYKVHSQNLIDWDTRLLETVYANLGHKRLVSSNDTVTRTGYDVYSTLFTEIVDSVRSTDHVQYYELFDYVDQTTDETCKSDCKQQKSLTNQLNENDFSVQFQQYCLYPDIERYEKDNYQKNIGLLVSNEMFFIARPDGSFNYYNIDLCFDLCDALKLDNWNDDGCVGVQIVGNSCKLLKEIKFKFTENNQENAILYTKTFQYTHHVGKRAFWTGLFTEREYALAVSDTSSLFVRSSTDCYLLCNQYNDCIGYEQYSEVSCIMVRGNIEEVFIVKTNFEMSLTPGETPQEVCAQYLSVVAECEIDYGHTYNDLNSVLLCMANGVINSKIGPNLPESWEVFNGWNPDTFDDRQVACKGYNPKTEEILPFDPVFTTESAESDYQPARTIFDVVRQLAARDKPQDNELFIYKQLSSSPTCGGYGDSNNFITISKLQDYITDNDDFNPRDFGWVQYDATTTSAFTNGQFYIASVEESELTLTDKVLDIDNGVVGLPNCVSLSTFDEACKIFVAGFSYPNPNKYIVLYPSSVISEAGTWCESRRHFDLRKSGIQQPDVAKIVIERFANDVLVDVAAPYQPARDLYTFCHDTKGFNVFNAGRWNWWCVAKIYESLFTSSL